MMIDIKSADYKQNAFVLKILVDILNWQLVTYKPGYSYEFVVGDLPYPHMSVGLFGRFFMIRKI